MKLTRFSENPIIAPSKNWWEINATFNPGVSEKDGKVVLLYRALGGDGLSRFGLAESNDGFKFERFETPLLEADPQNPYERLGIEDPRITKINETFYIVYNAASVYPAETYAGGNYAPSLYHPAPWRVRPELLTTKDFKEFEKKGLLLDTDTKDCFLFPEKINNYFVLAHRKYPNFYLTFSTDLINWEKEEVLISPREGFWDSERVGGGAPPLKTSEGWLLFYHGTDKNHVYRLGILLLDLNEPSKVLYRSKEPLLEPEEAYERKGITENVVFTCGALERNDQYLVYYGAGDKVICLASINKDELLNFLKN